MLARQSPDRHRESWFIRKRLSIGLPSRLLYTGKQFCDVIMTKLDIAHLRLANQHISSPTFKKPSDVVGWLGAVQAQDYLGSLWAVGLRMHNATEHAIEQAIIDRKIVRTWPMRGTLHYVLPEDVRWMIELLAPRVIASNEARQLKQFELDHATIKRCKELFERALQGGKHLTRDGMYKALEAAHISTAKGRGLQILWRVAPEGTICFGARQGRQPTFVLLDEWIPATKALERDEALAKLASRYFASHGPATIQDSVWWSGLTVVDAKAGIAMAGQVLVQEVIDGETYWLSSTARRRKDAMHSAYLLPSYDEYTVGYRDRSASFDARNAKQMNYWNNILFSPTIVIDGRIVGTWKRTFEKDRVVIKLLPFQKLAKAEGRAVAEAAHRYAEYLEKPLVLK